MKKKKYLFPILLLLFIGSGAFVLSGSFARYSSKATGNTTLNIAPWKIKVNGTDITKTSTITNSNINWSNALDQYIDPDYIAPGKTGTFSFEMDPTGSKVAMQFKIKFNTASISNHSQIEISGFTAKAGTTPLTITGNQTDGYTGIIPLATVQAGTLVKGEATITWNDLNTVGGNAADTAIGTNTDNVPNFSIPVEVTVEQYLG